MGKSLARYWRVIGTGISFVLFGAGGLVLGFVILRVLHLLGRTDRQRVMWSREAIRLSFRFFIGVMNGLGVLRYSCTGLERLERRGLLILANHPSLIDAVFLMAFVRNADCVVDAPLGLNPFTQGGIRMASYIRNDLGGLPMVEACIASLETGGNLVFFPEGMRTTPGCPIRLMRGGAQVAVRGARDVTPVIIRCVPPTLTRGEKWWRVPPRRAQFTIEVHEDIAVRPFLEHDGAPPLAARALNAYLQQYFTRESQSHASA
jgi:1-acyl-sn-glycerol-3-phosphate acyltransferase